MKAEQIRYELISEGFACDGIVINVVVPTKNILSC